jgi:hypothetical protein
MATDSFCKGDRVVAVAASPFGRWAAGEMGTVYRAELYIPGLDAGSIDIDLDSGERCAHWTDGEALRYWSPVIADQGGDMDVQV